eukprot:3150935-Alexandrium_andersonii.AAC.1
MSASLVGSEMCIRDRAEEEPRGPAWPEGSGGRREEAAVARDSSATTSRCLLYTSDAADDM